jgi:hypothetical protein
MDFFAAFTTASLIETLWLASSRTPDSLKDTDKNPTTSAREAVPRYADKNDDPQL